ncbi:hypothetical protein SDC9_121522 [bioreactor metagenome]|uniref:Uncharacterized protein n=1 Tax=bioreactor metagenome TaxID=1076179 RepID=A0A645CC76_9ZZZZ
MQAGGKIHHRHDGVIDFNIDVIERHARKRDRIRRGEIQRPAVLFFLYLLRRRHFFTVDRHINVFERQIVHAQAAVPQAIQPDRQMHFPGVNRHTRLVKADIFQRQITPAAGDLTNFQPRYPAICRIEDQMQAGCCSNQKRHRSQQQQDKNQDAEAYLLP